VADSELDSMSEQELKQLAKKVGVDLRGQDDLLEALKKAAM
jgi:gamma-glutamyl-gamma-aminobutyrate hydrolase PuuD